MYRAGGTQRLPRLIGRSKAKEMIFTGRFVGPEEAVGIGKAKRPSNALCMLVQICWLDARLQFLWWFMTSTIGHALHSGVHFSGWSTVSVCLQFTVRLS